LGEIPDNLFRYGYTNFWNDVRFDLFAYGIK